MQSLQHPVLEAFCLNVVIAHSIHLEVPSNVLPLMRRNKSIGSSSVAQPPACCILWLKLLLPRVISSRFSGFTSLDCLHSTPATLNNILSWLSPSACPPPPPLPPRHIARLQMQFCPLTFATTAPRCKYNLFSSVANNFSLGTDFSRLK